jgi:glycosyltransferase involved in cell wall biosynthesis
VQVPLAVLLERKQREGGGKAVRYAGLDGDLRPDMPEDRVEVGAFRITDGAERVAAAPDGGLMLASLLEQMIDEPALAHLPLIPRKHVATAEKVRDLGPNLSGGEEASRVTHVACSAVERAFQAADRIVATVRVLHLPVNLAGTGWAHVNALRRKGVDARLLVFWPQQWRPDEYDINLDLPRQGLLRQQLVQWRALAKYLPQTDLFHFYFGKTLVPKSLNLPILRATRKKSVMHFLGDDIRNKPLAALEYRKRFDAWIVGSYAATRWVPDATAVIPPGLDLRDYEPVPAVERERPLVVHAPSNLEKKGTQYVIEACKQLPVDLEVVHGVPHDEAVERFKRADIVVDQLHYLWHGVFAIESMAYGKPVVTHLDPDAVRETEEGFGVKVPIVAATKDDLVEKLRPLVDSFELRRRLGAEGRVYVEQVHDLDKVADRFIELYKSIL